MYDELVVIATNNGGQYLPRLLETLGDKWPILVVDTRSTDEQFLDYLKTLPLHCQTPYQGFSTGAYLWTYFNYPAKNYLFLQDSMEVLEPEYLEKFKEIMPERGAVSWCWFGFGYDNTPQKEWSEYHYGPGNDPERGIFGPIFYTNRESLDILRDSKWLPGYPTTKAQAQGTERTWALAFHRMGLNVPSVSGEWNHPSMQVGTFPIFKKVWADRK